MEIIAMLELIVNRIYRISGLITGIKFVLITIECYLKMLYENLQR